MRIIRYITAFTMLLLPLITRSAASTDTQASLSNETQELKRLTLELNRDIGLLEEELLFPSSTQVSIFLSLDISGPFILESVKLNIDDQQVAGHLYSDRETAALQRGGIQRLHYGNLHNGEHEIGATLTGTDSQGRAYTQSTTTRINKALQPKYVEFKITDKTEGAQPELSVKDW